MNDISLHLLRFFCIFLEFAISSVSFVSFWNLRFKDLLQCFINLALSFNMSWLCFSNNNALSRVVSVMDGQSSLILNLKKLQFFLSSMFLNHYITLLDFFHWLTYKKLTKCLLICSMIGSSLLEGFIKWEGKVVDYKLCL